MQTRSERTKREDYELPASTEGILSSIRWILSQPGKVFKVVIESGRGIIVYREPDSSSVDLMEDATSLDAALRNSDLVEYDNDGGSQFEKLHDMFYILNYDNLYPVAWATGLNQTGLLNKWLTISGRGLPTSSNPTGMERVLGIPLVRIPSLPEETLILCGSRVQDADYQDITVGVKTVIDLDVRREDAAIKEKLSEAGDRSRPSKEGVSETVGSMGPSVRGPYGASWNPKAVFGVWMENGFGVRKGS